MPEEKKKGKILQPGDPEFEQLLSMVPNAPKAMEGYAGDAGVRPDLVAPMDSMKAKFTIREYSKFDVHHAIQEMGEFKVNLAFHFKRIAYSRRERLSMYLYHEIVIRMAPPCKIEAADSMVWKDQWDFYLYRLPRFEAPIIRDSILRIVDKFVEQDGKL